MRELAELGDGEVTMKIFRSGLRKRSRDLNSDFMVNSVHKTDLAFLQDGSVVKLTRVDDKSIKIERTTAPEIEDTTTPGGEATVTHRPMKSDSEKISNQEAMTLVNYMTSKISSLFPNLRVVEVNNSNTTEPGAAAFVESGITYINRDLITPETPLHEIRHLYLAFIRETNPGQYRDLKKMAQSL